MIVQSMQRSLSAVVLLLVSVLALVVLGAQAPTTNAKPRPEVQGGALLTDLRGPATKSPHKHANDAGVVDMSTWEETGFTSTQRR